MAILKQDQVNKNLSSLKNWNFENNQIGKEYQFKDFAEALAFVNKAGAAAEEMNHHPDILMHSWNKVKITVSTHSEGGVTEKDFQLAQKLESF